MPVVGTVKSVVDIAQLASELVVEIVLPALVLVVEEPLAGKAFAENWEVVDNLFGRLGNLVVEIADQAASHFLATVAGNDYVDLSSTIRAGPAPILCDTPLTLT